MVALQALIDFAGFRLQAMLALPLEEHVVGSDDACVTPPRDEEAACKTFKMVADHLGLAEHDIKVGDKTVKLHFGADVEGHRGKDKTKLYVLDTARTYTANEVSQNQPENPRMRPDSGLSFWEWVGFWVFDKCHSGLPRMCLILGPILGIIKPIFISPTRKKESGGGGARPCLQPPPNSRTLLLRATNSLSTPGLGVSTTCSHADMHPHPPHPIPRFSSNRRFFQR